MDDECLGLGSPAYCVMAGMAEIRTTEIPQDTGMARHDGTAIISRTHYEPSGAAGESEIRAWLCTTVLGTNEETWRHESGDGYTATAWVLGVGCRVGKAKKEKRKLAGLTCFASRLYCTLSVFCT